MTLNVTIENTSINGKIAKVTVTDEIPTQDKNGNSCYELREIAHYSLTNGCKQEFVLTETTNITVWEE